MSTHKRQKATFPTMGIPQSFKYQYKRSHISPRHAKRGFNYHYWRDIKLLKMHPSQTKKSIVIQYYINDRLLFSQSIQLYPRCQVLNRILSRFPEGVSGISGGQIQQIPITHHLHITFRMTQPPIILFHGPSYPMNNMLMFLL